MSDSGARGPGFETYRRRVVSLSKTLYSPKVLVNPLPRKRWLRPDMTEKLLTGTLNLNTTNQPYLSILHLTAYRTYPTHLIHVTIYRTHPTHPSTQPNYTTHPTTYQPNSSSNSAFNSAKLHISSYSLSTQQLIFQLSQITHLTLQLINLTAHSTQPSTHASYPTYPTHPKVYRTYSSNKLTTHSAPPSTHQLTQLTQLILQLTNSSFNLTNLPNSSSVQRINLNS